MEAIIINNQTRKRRIENLSIEDYYNFGSSTERLVPGHPTLFKQEVENVLKSLIWELIHSLPNDYPHTDLNKSEDLVKGQARTEAFIRLRNKIDKILGQ